MRPIDKATIWAKEVGFTPRQAHRLGGYEWLMELQKRHPDAFAVLLADSKKRKKVAA
jgi:hypothetical protein